MSSISTRDLSRLPDLPTLRRLLQSLAMLDAILSREWQFRYYSFNSAWSPDEQMGSMRNGSGDEFFALFNPNGCFIKGFDHEAPINGAGLDSAQFYRAVPAEFSEAAQEPAFSTQNVTFCLWRLNADNHWSHATVDMQEQTTGDHDGSGQLLSILDGAPDKYQAFAEDYYEEDISIDTVKAVYNHQTLTENLVHELNPEVDIAELKPDAIEIGYPV